MDSKQIRAALKPLIDFAPAVMKAAEIVEAAEIAEKALANATKTDAERKAALIQDIGALEESKSKILNSIEVARRDLATFNENSARDRSLMSAELAAAHVAHEKALNDLDSARQQKEQEVARLQAMRDEKQAELDRVVRAFEAFKAAHKL